MDDNNTKFYFDKFTPHYNPKRFKFALDFLEDEAEQDASLLDVGCGDGATLALISEATRIKNLWGLDVSENYLSKASANTGCQTILGSILDDELVMAHQGSFDYCTLGAVLHHLIGKSRDESFQFGECCLSNCLKLLKPGGMLLIFEPTHSPAVVMDAVFWIKKTVGRIVKSRVELGPAWLNIGHPIVSYYTEDQLRLLIEQNDAAEMQTFERINENRLGGFINRIGIGAIIVKK